MNVAQIARLALLNVDAVLINGTTNRLYTQAELLAWANQGKEQIETILRQARANYQVSILSSTSTDTRFNRWFYDTASLQFTGTTSNSHELPPNFIALKNIYVTTDANADLEFQYMDPSDPYWISLLKDTNPQRSTIMYTILGERTLYVANPPSATVDCEIYYIAKSPWLRVYTTGSITLTQDSSTLTGASTLWTDDEVSTNSEIIIGQAASVAPAFATQTSGLVYVDPSETYARIATLTSDIAGTLSGTWLTANVAAGTGYMIASRTEFPEEHDHALADYVAHRCMVKAKNWAAADKFEGYWDKHIAKFIADIAQRQFMDVEYAEEFYPDED